MAGDDDRWGDIQARLDRLEDRLEERLAAPPAAAPDDLPDTFWVLDGLRRRPPAAVTYAGIVAVDEHAPIEWQMGHPADELLDRDWTRSSAGLAALAHPVRLRILQLVALGEASTAAEITRVADLGTTGQIYHHLRQLVAAGWLRATTHGGHQVPAERLVPLLVIIAAAG